MSQRMDWRIFENSLKTEARIFNRMQVNDLTPIFDSIGALQSRDGYPLVVDAGRGPIFIYHIRSFNLTTILNVSAFRQTAVALVWLFEQD
jgi:hypothetical protein